MNNIKRFDLPLPWGWFAVTRSADLAVGQAVPLNYFEQDLVLFRTESGQARVLHAICPHLGAHLGHGGQVHGESIACPFHGWQFNGDGFCTDVPYAKNMPPKVAKQACIPHFPSCEKNGFVYVWYHPAQAEPCYEVEDIPEVSADDWELVCYREWTINAPLQELGENAVDKAHFAYVHSAEHVPDAEVAIEGHRRNTLLVSSVPAFDDEGKPLEDGSYQELRLDSSNLGAGLTYQKFSGLLDTVHLGLVTPVSAEQVHLRFAFYHPMKERTEMEQIKATGFVEETCRQVEQDIPIWNHKHYQPNPILCDGDGPIAQFRKWFSQFYASPEPG